VGVLWARRLSVAMLGGATGELFNTIDRWISLLFDEKVDKIILSPFFNFIENHLVAILMMT
jgi:hypothetical protein